MNYIYRMKNIICLLFVLLFNGLLFAQTDTIEFFINGSEEKTNPHLATYYRLGIKEVNYWKGYDFYLSNEKIRMTAYFLDDSLTVKQGPCVYYSKAGTIISKSNFTNGKLSGVKKSWYENGIIKDSAMYNNGVLIGTETAWYENGHILSVKKFDTSGNGNGEYVRYYDNGNTRDSGFYENNKRNKTWYFYRENKTPASEVVFLNDSVISYRAFDKNGSILDKVKDFEKEAKFIGGETGWSNYVSQKLSALYERSDAALFNGTCDVIFVVNSNGTISDVDIVSSTNDNLSEFVTKLLLGSRKWEPAIQYNLPVKAWRKQRFTISPQ
jgi:antitoxin component YwqK of YwqJK toxin-antitoxin module